MSASRIQGLGMAIAAEAVLATAPLLAQSPVPYALGVGAQYNECQSALQVGPQDCNDSARSTSNHAARVVAEQREASFRPQMETRIDEFLASFGKPPREAVRALLDPSDDNIRAYLAQQDKTLALASYVAARMTALKQDENPSRLRDNLSRDEPGFSRMRLSLHQTARDRSTQETLRVLAELVRSMPSLQAGVVLAKPVDASQLKDVLDRIDPALSVLPAPVAAVDTSRLPFLRIEDLQSGAVYDVDARDLGIDQIREAVLAVRKSGAAINAPADLANLPGTRP